MAKVEKFLLMQGKQLTKSFLCLTFDKFLFVKTFMKEVKWERVIVYKLWRFGKLNSTSFMLVAPGGLYFSIYITVYSPY